MPSPQNATSDLVASSATGCAGLHRFLAGKNADAARQAVKAIRESVKVLAHQPGMGVQPRIWSGSIESGSPISGRAAMWPSTTMTVRRQ